MTAVRITCSPDDEILALSADTVSALDALALTLPAGRPWQIDVLVGATPADTIHLLATPATDQSQEDAR